MDHPRFLDVCVSVSGTANRITRQPDKDVFPASVDGFYPASRNPACKMFGKRKAQIRTPRFGKRDGGAHHHGAQSATNGLNFRQFRHERRYSKAGARTLSSRPS